jgi:hypothetical protein
MVWYLLEDTKLIPFLLTHGPKVSVIEAKSPDQKENGTSPEKERGQQNSGSVGSGEKDEKIKPNNIQVSGGSSLTAQVKILSAIIHEF